MPPFHEPFTYCPADGELLLLPVWASVSVAYGEAAGECGVGPALSGGCAAVDLLRFAITKPLEGGPGQPAGVTTLRSSDVIDKMLLMTPLGLEVEELPHAGSIVSGIEPVNLRPSLPPYLKRSFLASLGVTTLDLFGSWVLHVSVQDLARYHGLEVDPVAFNAELKKLSLTGIDHPHFKKLPRHERSESFFYAQQQMWRKGERFPGFAESRAFQQLQELMLAGVRLCLGTQDETLDDSLLNSSFVWGAAISHGEDHTEHFHGPGHLISAAYYADAPEGSGNIFFADPRGPYPPFYGGFFGMLPRTGDFVFFPSWLRHGVKKSYFKSTKIRRVAYSQNIDGEWATTARVHRWRRLPLLDARLR